MGKENTRTLKNSTYNNKSKKNSKKSKKNKKDNTTTEEMKQILDSETENVVGVKSFLGGPDNNQANPPNKGLVQYEGELPQHFQNQQMMQMAQMQQMGQMQQQMGQQMPQMQQMVSPMNYDPLMLQQMAPVQTAQAFQSMGMPSNLATPSQMMGNVNRLASLSNQPAALNGGQGGQEGTTQFSLRGGNPFKNSILNLANLSLKIQRIN